MRQRRFQSVTYSYRDGLRTIRLRNVRRMWAWEAFERGLRPERCVVGVNEQGAEVALLERRVLAIA